MARPAMDELWGGPNEAAADVDALILVDEADREVGHLSKAKCHDGQGVLHRAFSLARCGQPMD